MRKCGYNADTAETKREWRQPNDSKATAQKKSFVAVSTFDPIWGHRSDSSRCLTYVREFLAA